VLNRCPAPLPKAHSFAGYAPRRRAGSLAY